MEQEKRKPSAPEKISKNMVPKTLLRLREDFVEQLLKQNKLIELYENVAKSVDDVPPFLVQ